MSGDRCEFEHSDYCCPPDCIVRAGFKCSSAIPIKEGDITEKCGANDDDLMTEDDFLEAQAEEWEAMREARE